MVGLKFYQILDSCIKINQFHEIITNHSGFCIHPRGWLDHERNIRQTILERILVFFHQTVISSEITMITEHKNDRVIIDSFFLKCLNQQAKLVINSGDHTKIYRSQFIVAFFCPVIQMLIFTDSIQHCRFQICIFRFWNSWFQMITVDHAEKWFFYPVRRMWKT